MLSIAAELDEITSSVVMEHKRRLTIPVLARAQHQPRNAMKMTKLPKATLYCVYNAFLKSGDISRKTHVHGSDKKCTTTFLTRLKRSIKVNQCTPMTVLAKNRNVSMKTIHKAIHEDLGMSSYICQCRNLLTEKAKAIRAKQCLKLLSFLKNKASKELIWVNENKFIVDAKVNRQNQCVMACFGDQTPSLCHGLWGHGEWRHPHGPTLH